MASVLIAYPHEVWAAGLRGVLKPLGCHVTRCCKSLDEALSALETTPTDVLIVARDLLGEPALRRHETAGWAARIGKLIVVLEPNSVFSAPDMAALNVEGLILSSSSAEQFAVCVAGVLKGDQWLDPAILGLLDSGERTVGDCRELSKRETEIARLAADGLSNKEIALMLDVSDGTIKMHMHHIFTKLRLANRFELVELFERGPLQLIDTRHRVRNKSYSPKILSEVDGDSVHGRYRGQSRDI